MQDGTNTTDRVADADETTIEIVSVPDEFGTIVLGNEHDIEEFAQAGTAQAGTAQAVTMRWTCLPVMSRRFYGPFRSWRPKFRLHVTC